MTGKGVTVAVLESGYDVDHPDLKEVVSHERNFTDSPDMRDVNGHGTHVASIIAGAGEKYRGVVPDAKLAIAKVGDGWSTDSAVLAGMEWAAVDVKAKVINPPPSRRAEPGRWRRPVARTAAAKPLRWLR
ncbi:S8 family peptidase [Streptosporangium sandarakinum]|uniref:S8 family peptidase n=1 Tax=Streptosporangium sandarakinum TaxID=1260955 RepID=UPI003441B7F4